MKIGSCDSSKRQEQQPRQSPKPPFSLPQQQQLETELQDIRQLSNLLHYQTAYQTKTNNNKTDSKKINSDREKRENDTYLRSKLYETSQQFVVCSFI